MSSETLAKESWIFGELLLENKGCKISLRRRKREPQRRRVCLAPRVSIILGLAAAARRIVQGAQTLRGKASANLAHRRLAAPRARTICPLIFLRPPPAASSPASLALAPQTFAEARLKSCWCSSSLSSTAGAVSGMPAIFVLSLTLASRY